MDVGLRFSGIRKLNISKEPTCTVKFPLGDANDRGGRLYTSEPGVSFISSRSGAA